jgi:hypothetical protein
VADKVLFTIDDLETEILMFIAQIEREYSQLEKHVGNMVDKLTEKRSAVLVLEKDNFHRIFQASFQSVLRQAVNLCL